MPTDLKDCPFCGGVNIVPEGFHMTCWSCGADGPDGDNKDKESRIVAWNRRVDPVATPSQPTRDSTAKAESAIAISSEAKQLREALEKARMRLEFAASMFDASNTSDENYSRDRARAAEKCRDEIDAIDSALSGAEGEA
jgi:hypothetical protein